MTGIIHEKDRHGNDIYFADGGDVRYPLFPLLDDYKQHMQNLRHTPLREDDVILVGFPKSGFHWLQEIIHMLMTGVVEHIQTEPYRQYLDASPASKLLPPDKARLLWSHFRFHHLPLAVTEKKLKVVHLTRNPKDVWVSLFNQFRTFKLAPPFQGTWEHFFELMIEDHGLWYGNWFDHVLDWEKEIAAHPDLPIMQSSFEDMKRDPLGQILKINKFLELNRDRQLCERIAQACEFSTLKSVKDKQAAASWDKTWQKGSCGYYRKGEIGDWKNWFTVAHNEQFDAVFERRMAGSKLTFTFV